MPIFQRSFYSPEQTFTNLFRLLDDFDTYNREVNAAQEQQQPADAKAVQTQAAQGTGVSRPTRQGLPQVTRLFNPRFDVRETENTYELHGELPGVEKKDLSIEFTEPQTLVVSGRIERNYTSNNEEDTSKADDTTMSGAVGGTATPNSEARSLSPSRHATVTDEATEEALEKGEPASTVAKKDENTSVSTPAQPLERYWYQERSVGQFHRTFSFPAPVDESRVKASLDNGILNISVPKANKRETRRITVF